jgi:DNA-binding SARP family transcriptional activator
MLSGFSLVAADAHHEAPEGCQRLLVQLALRDRPQCRAVVAATLWPEKSDARACANLRSALWRLPTPGGAPLVVAEGATLRLSERVDVDVRRAEALGWALVRGQHNDIDDVDIGLFLGELLPGWYDDWVIFERERIAQLQVHFLEALSDLLLMRGRIPQALDVALRLVAADPFREGSHRALLAVYRADRNVGQAQRHLEGYRELIRSTFGCDASPSLRAMVHDER